VLTTSTRTRTRSPLSSIWFPFSSNNVALNDSDGSGAAVEFAAGAIAAAFGGVVVGVIALPAVDGWVPGASRTRDSCMNWVASVVEASCRNGSTT